jgi:hypothetical protein
MEGLRFSGLMRLLFIRLLQATSMMSRATNGGISQMILNNTELTTAKKSAYMVYWLNKLRPIYVERPSADPADLEASLNDDTSIIVNGQFALTAAYVYMNLMFSEELAEQLLYILTYRSTDPNALIFIFEMADAIRNKKDVIIT